jgi:hypothetical protein
LCDQAPVWKYTQQGESIRPDHDRFTYEPPEQADRVRIQWLTYRGCEIDPIAEDELRFQNPQWSDEKGEPRRYYESEPGIIQLWPTPRAKETRAINLRLQLRPCSTAVAMSHQVLEDWHQVIINGALGFLYLMPSHPWTSPEMGVAFNQMFRDGVLRAVNRGRDSNVKIHRKIRYGGI